MNFGQMKYMLRRVSGESTDESRSYYGNTTCALFLHAGAVEVSGLVQPSITYWPSATTPYDDPALAPDDNRREGRYGLPSALVSLKGVEILSGVEWVQLTVHGFDDFMRKYGSTTASSEPEAYMVQWGAVDQTSSPIGDVWLGPKPNAVIQYRVSGYKLPIPIGATDDSKTYEVQEPFHNAIVYHAARALVIGNDDKSRFQTFNALYEQAVTSALNIVGRRDRTGGFATTKANVRTKGINRRGR